jgi:hypothetical protein
MSFNLTEEGSSNDELNFATDSEHSSEDPFHTTKDDEDDDNNDPTKNDPDFTDDSK